MEYFSCGTDPQTYEAPHTVKYLLKYIAVLEPPCIVFAEGGKVRYLFGHSISDEPPVRHVDFRLRQRLPHTPNPKCILQHYQFKQNHRIDPGPAPVDGRIQVCYFVPDKIPVYRILQLPHQMIRRHKIVQTDYLRLPYDPSVFFCIHSNPPPLDLFYHKNSGYHTSRTDC